MTAAPQTHTAWSSGRALARQLVGVLGPPAAWLTGFEVNYALLRSACRGGSMAALHLVFALTLVAIAACALLSARTRASAPGVPHHGETGGPVGRSKLLGTVGLLAAGVFALAALAQWIPVFIVDRCAR